MMKAATIPVEPFDLNLTYRSDVGSLTGATLAAELGQGKVTSLDTSSKLKEQAPCLCQRQEQQSQYLLQSSIGSIGPSILVTLPGGTSSMTGI
jgi:hypothetical protein